jgi:hypothetical protein
MENIYITEYCKQDACSRRSLLRYRGRAATELLGVHDYNLGILAKSNIILYIQIRNER